MLIKLTNKNVLLNFIIDFFFHRKRDGTSGGFKNDIKFILTETNGFNALKGTFLRVKQGHFPKHTFDTYKSSPVLSFGE